VTVYDSLHSLLDCQCLPLWWMTNNESLLTHWASLRSRSQSHIATDGQSISKSWCRAPPGTHDQIFFTVWQLRSCFCGAPSLTRGRACLLYMLLALARAVFLRSESLGTLDHILLSQIWDFPFRRLLRFAGLRWRTVTVLFLWGAHSDERTGLSFVYAAGPCQNSLSRVRVPWYSRPYFTVSDLRLPFPSPPTIRRVTVEVFEPASTRVGNPGS
jgi:hypothetical protein